MPGKSQRPWRKELKKQQRKRRRSKAAQSRDLELAIDEANKLKNPAYQQFLQQQAQLEAQQLREAERLHAEEEEAWLRRELLVQRELRLQQEKRAAAEASEMSLRMEQEKALVAKLAEEERCRKVRKENEVAAAAEFERMLQCMEEYLNKEGPPPVELRRIVESRPGQNLCVLYERTSCCRFGLTCINNHRRPLLSNIIVLRHFFTHPLLMEVEHKEYANADGALELSEQDLCEAYNEFFGDVLPELESFGYVINFRAVRNTLRYLRGHVFVEYVEERSALKAFIKLQGRFYAGKQINAEFANIPNWRNAICGLSHARKCPKGNKCYYLHLFHNPGNKYNTPIGANRTGSDKTPALTPLISWNTVTANDVKHNSRNWRWSESPEVELSTTKSENEAFKKIGCSNIAVCNKEREESLKTNGMSCSDTNIKVVKTKEKYKIDYTEKKSKRKSKKHKHEREKSHKKHKRKQSHDAVDERNNQKRRDKNKDDDNEAKSRSSRSSTICSINDTRRFKHVSRERERSSGKSDNKRAQIKRRRHSKEDKDFAKDQYAS
uniref:U2 small nuclear ribonucleoprotein auxiliary factor 35 kDa subunit-related protein 1 n=2 Tax=Ceratitis capitata TaxID=7213 RepID=W8BHU7_CERCA